jgi:hypothetical protein
VKPYFCRIVLAADELSQVTNDLAAVPWWPRRTAAAK